MATAKRNIQEAVYGLMTMDLTLGAVQVALEAIITIVEPATGKCV